MTMCTELCAYQRGACHPRASTADRCGEAALLYEHSIARVRGQVHQERDHQRHNLHSGTHPALALGYGEHIRWHAGLVALFIGGTASGSAEKRERLKPSALLRLSELLMNHLNCARLQYLTEMAAREHQSRR